MVDVHRGEILMAKSPNTVLWVAPYPSTMVDDILDRLKTAKVEELHMILFPAKEAVAKVLSAKLREKFPAVIVEPMQVMNAKTIWQRIHDQSGLNIFIFPPKDNAFKLIRLLMPSLKTAGQLAHFLMPNTVTVFSENAGTITNVRAIG